jgi:hypothetical protein
MRKTGSTLTRDFRSRLENPGSSRFAAGRIVDTAVNEEPASGSTKLSEPIGRVPRYRV